MKMHLKKNSLKINAFINTCKIRMGKKINGKTTPFQYSFFPICNKEKGSFYILTSPLLDVIPYEVKLRNFEPLPLLGAQIVKNILFRSMTLVFV
jgi:hypothetical protein